MGKRLSKIYTKTGDDGTTGLGDGSRVSKSSLRVEVLGEVDELNAFIGLVRAHLDKQGHHTIAIDVFLEVIQHDLFNIGGSLCFPEHATLLISEARITLIEDQLDHLNHTLDPLENFVLPGGSETSATIHVARTVCRRAERALVALADQTPVDVFPAACPHVLVAG